MKHLIMWAGEQTQASVMWLARGSLATYGLVSRIGYKLHGWQMGTPETFRYVELASIQNRVRSDVAGKWDS